MQTVADEQKQKPLQMSCRPPLHFMAKCVGFEVALLVVVVDDNDDVVVVVLN